MPDSRGRFGRRIAFVVLCLAAAALAIAYAVVSRSRRMAASRTSSAAHGAPRDASALAQMTARPHLLFRNTTIDDMFGKVGVVPLDRLDGRLDGPRQVTDLSCDRVHFAAGAGLCLTAKRGMTTSYRKENRGYA